MASTVVVMQNHHFHKNLDDEWYNKSSKKETKKGIS